MAKLCPLFSGSSGNSTYIACSEGAVLVDVGVNAKTLEGALQRQGLPVETIRGIFITHEHTDHIQGARVFADRYHIPLYATAGTLQAMEDTGSLPRKAPLHTLTPGQPVETGGMAVDCFATYHDCRESVGFTLTLPDGRRAAVCTDLGRVSEGVRAALWGCETVLLESNHDVRMLQNGSYPYFLKQRILGINGHLSNESCAAELADCVRQGTKRFILGHLSRENNLPALARETARGELADHDMLEGRDYLLWVAAPRDNDLIQW